LQTETAVETRAWTLITHRDPDIDDMVAIFAAKKFGEEEYPGIAKAKVITTGERSPGGKSADQLEKEGLICIGINGGKFDEHAFDGAASLQRHCAATLVADRFGVVNHPGLQALLDNAFARNYSASWTDHFELSVASKLSFRYLSHSGDAWKDQLMTERIIASTFLFFDAIFEEEMATAENRILKGRVTWPIDMYIGKWMLKKNRPNEKLSIDAFVVRARKSGRTVSEEVARFVGMEDNSNLEFILKYARDHQKVRGEELDVPSFGLAYLVEVAQRHLCVGDNINNGRYQISLAVNVLLDGLLAKDVAFADCIKDYESSDTRTFEIFGKNKKGKPRKIVITSVISANPEMPKFCRSEFGEHTAVGIKKDPRTGNVLIFFDKKQGIDPLPIVVSIRRAEILAKGLPLPPQEVLEAEGSIPGAMNWFWDKNQFMNGSLTADMPPTAISRERIERFVYSAVRLQFPES